MTRALAALALTLLSWGAALAGQRIPQPGGYGTGIDDASLKIPCLAEIDRYKEDAFVERFGHKSPNERRQCTMQMLAALTPEPGYTADEFRRSLVLRPDGAYSIYGAPPALLDRLGLNVTVSEVLRALADAGHLRDERVIDPLVACVNHPLLSVADYCDDVLTTLTKHKFNRGSFQDSSTTEASRRQIVELWKEFARSVRTRVYDAKLAVIVGEAAGAIGRAMRASVPLSPQSAAYLPRFESRGPVGLGADDETLSSGDVGRHNVANWDADRVQGVGVLILRPGGPMARASETYRWLVRDFATAEYQERFDALDVEVRVNVKTQDDAIRRRAVDAVSEALAGLRRENASAKSR